MYTRKQLPTHKQRTRVRCCKPVIMVDLVKGKDVFVECKIAAKKNSPPTILFLASFRD